MPESEANCPTLPLPQAEAIIRTFTTFFPPQEAKEALWQLMAGTMSGPHPECWTAEERSSMILFYRLAGELVEAVHALSPKAGS